MGKAKKEEQNSVAKREKNSPDKTEQTNDEQEISEEEIKDFIEDLPQPAKRQISRFFSSRTSMSISDEPPGLTKFLHSVGEKLNEDHITKIFDNAEKSDKRGFVHSLITRIGIGILIIVGIVAVIYIISLFKDDKEMALEIIEKIALVLGGLIGGLGGGYYLGRRKR
jgi:hypothetical protein